MLISINLDQERNGKDIHQTNIFHQTEKTWNYKQLIKITAASHSIQLNKVSTQLKTNQQRQKTKTIMFYQRERTFKREYKVKPKNKK